MPPSCSFEAGPQLARVWTRHDPRFSAEKTRLRPVPCGPRLSSELIAVISPDMRLRRVLVHFADRAASRVAPGPYTSEHCAAGRRDRRCAAWRTRTQGRRTRKVEIGRRDSSARVPRSAFELPRKGTEASCRLMPNVANQRLHARAANSSRAPVDFPAAASAAAARHVAGPVRRLRREGIRIQKSQMRRSDSAYANQPAASICA